jgi:hypothetical protein
LNAVSPVLEDWLVVGSLVFTWAYAAGNIACKHSKYDWIRESWNTAAY